MKYSKIDKQILSELFKASDGLYLFTLHRHLNLSPKELFNSVEKLKSSGFVEVSNDRVVITKDGVKYSTQMPLKLKKEIKIDKLIKEEFLGERININEFYIPYNYEK